MARVPVPQQGQPLDLSYISTLANAVNQLSEEGAALAQGNNFILRGDAFSTSSSHKLYGAQIIAQQISLVAGTGDTIEQTVSFSPYNFKGAPIVTATLADSSDNKAIVSLKDITSSSVKVSVKFPTSENNKTNVNITAIGLPSSVS